MSDQRNFRQKWHEQVNRVVQSETDGGKPWAGVKFMYDAMHAQGEATRLALLFKMEREKTLTQTHRQCSHSPTVPVVNNHLTCCLGKKCAECPYLQGLEKCELTPDEIDKTKAWTCVTHILQNGGDVAGEGFIMTVDDRMFWDNVYSSLAYETGDEPDELDETEDVPS